MTQLVLTIAGTYIGAQLGYPQLGAAIGSYVGARIAAPDIEGPRIQDTQAPTSSYGAAVQRTWGSDRVAGSVIWAAPVVEIATEEGGKGGPSITTYSYTRSFAILIGEGEIPSIRRIWADGKLVRDLSDGTDLESQAQIDDVGAYMVFYSGSESQLPDATIEAIEGVGEVEAFRGSAYVVFTDLPLTPYGNRIPLLTFEVSNEPETAVPGDTVLEPLVVYSWTIDPITGRPIHQYRDSLGVYVESTQHTAISYPPAGTSTSLTTTAEAQALALGTDSGIYGYEAGRYATTYSGFFYDSTNEALSDTPGGASLDGDEETVYLKLSAYGSEYGPIVDTTYNLNAPTEQHTFIYPQTPSSWVETVLVWRLEHGGAGAPPGGYASAPYSQTVLSVSPYTLSTAWATYALTTSGERIPAHNGRSCYPGRPCGAAADDYRAEYPGRSDYCVSCAGEITWNYSWQTITGTAKQLCAVEYRGGVLYQQALGPVLLPGDPNYSNSAFWDAEYAAALLAGTINAGVTYPVVVASYAEGTRPDAAQVDRGSVLLSEIVADICAEAGLSSGQIDVTDLTDTAIGFSRTRRMPARSALDTLRAAYHFDGVESGDLIRFVKRGGAVAASLTADDLGAGAEQAAPELVETMRAQEAELPLSMSVSYKAADGDYTPGAQQALRRVGVTEQQAGTELAIVLTDDHAAQIAQVLLYEPWAARTKRAVTVGMEWARIEPTDVIEIDDGAFSYTVRVIDRAEQNGVLKLQCEDMDPDVYTSTAVGGTVGAGGVAALAGPTRAELLDIPLLRDADDSASFYLAGSGYRPEWRGGALFVSNSGADYVRAATLDRVAVMGRCTTILGDFLGGNVFDEFSTLEVSIAVGDLSTVTAAQMLNNMNAAVVGDEILQFRTATLLSPGLYRLTGFLRGRRGTEQHMGTHVADERFVLLTTAALQRPAFPLDLLNIEQNYKAVSEGGALADVEAQAFTNTGAGLKPLSPVHLDVVALPSSAGYSVRWVRRTRIGGVWVDGSDAPVGETSERYRVRVLFGTAVEETQTVTTNSATVGVGEDLTYRLIEVAQISDTVGPGFTATYQL